MKIFQRGGLFLLFPACGLLVFLVFSYYFPVYEGARDIVGRKGLFLGKFLTNIATTPPFVLAHAPTNYSTDQFVFLVFQTLPVSLAWCWLMQKSNSIWVPFYSMPQWIFRSWSGFFQDRKQ